MLKLKKLTSKNIWKIVNLDVYSNQKQNVASNAESIIEAYITEKEKGVAYPFGIYDNNTPVGFLMIGYGVGKDYKDAPEILKNSYCIWRLMIDKKYQRKGYGRKAINLALDFIKTWPNGEAKNCYLSYEPENQIAKKLYESFGFKETKYKDGNEIVAIKEI